MPAETAQQSSLAPQLRDSALDPGLRDTHEYMGRLGRGGTGEICQFRDKQTGKHVRRNCPYGIMLVLYPWSHFA